MTEHDPAATQLDPGSGLVPELAAELSESGFEDVEEIGHGGFGAVFRCVQPELDRTVAVKVLTTALDEENRERFVREQRAMGRLTGHPNIVGVLHIGHTATGRPYLVMQYHRRGSLHARIRRDGPLAVAEVLDLGIKIADALRRVHELEIVHRDVKPANILFTDYGEPALADFGIAQIAGAFRTAAGTVTGSPAFTAPEVLGGDTPTPASDIYELGATLFCAVTGHAAFERHSGEQVIAQFLRITSAPAPDLRAGGIDRDLATVVEQAMARDPADRPSAAALIEQLRRVRAGLDGPAAASPAPIALAGRAELPVEMTSFVGRRRELADIRDALVASHLVMLTGIGGVGKTRLALRTAALAGRTFPDGVWLVELAEVHDPEVVVDVVAATLGVRGYVGRPLIAALADALSEWSTLLVLDNCEQVIDAVADLVSPLLARCPELRILATSREPLRLAGETVVRVSPLTTPLADEPPSLRAVARSDAVTLFVERATAAVPGFELTEDNMSAVAQICARLDGLPLAIELAVARLRALSPDQILERLTDRYALLTRGSRGAPTRQQTLRWSIEWSYDLCTPEEQRLWGRLSLFSGGFGLEDAEYVCGAGSPDLLDTLTSLVDKSIVLRDDGGDAIGFRLLDTVQAYGREKAEASEEWGELRRRHRDRYRQKARDAEADWNTPRQLDWSAHLAREFPNLREAFEHCVAEPDDSALEMATALYPYWIARGLFAEGRRWLDRALDRSPPRSATLHAKALYSYCVLAGMQGDLPPAVARADQARALDSSSADPTARAFIAAAEGITAFCGGDIPRAQERLKAAADAPCVSDERQLQLESLSLLGWAHVGDHTTRALTYQGSALALAESYGEFVHRGYSLWANGVDLCRAGDTERGRQLLEDGLRLTRRTHDPLMVSTCLQALAWLAAEQGRTRFAAVLMGAAEAHRRVVGSPPVLFPNLLAHHKKFIARMGDELGAELFETACREGASMTTDAAIAHALGEQVRTQAGSAAGAVKLTKREGQVADLIAEGLTNKAIAARLVISQRTAEGHVDRILSKLEFVSRAQIAAWVAERK